MRAARAGAVVVVLGLTLAACGDDQEPAEDATQACAAQEQLAAALDDFDAVLGPDATVDEVREARNAVADAADEAEAAATDVAEDRVQAVVSARGDLDAAVDDLEGDETIADAVDSLRDDAQEVADARAALADDLGCD